MDEAEELAHARRIVRAWQRPPSELWLVAKSQGDTDAAELVRRIFAVVTPLSRRLAMLESDDAEDRRRAARTVYRIQTMIAGAYVDAQRELEDEACG